MCEKCLKETDGTYFDGRQWVCFDCLPQSEKDRYPGWAERVTLKRKRAALAQANFHHHTEAAC